MKATAPNPQAASRLRQRLRTAHDELGALLAVFLARDPLFRGSAGERTVRCGRPKCHCASGPGHPAWTITYREGGKTRNRVLPVEDRARFVALIAAYRRARAAQRQWRELVREIDGIIAALLESRSVAYSPRQKESK